MRGDKSHHALFRVKIHDLLKFDFCFQLFHHLHFICYKTFTVFYFVVTKLLIISIFKEFSCYFSYILVYLNHFLCTFVHFLCIFVYLSQKLHSNRDKQTILQSIQTKLHITHRPTIMIEIINKCNLTCTNERVVTMQT